MNEMSSAEQNDETQRPLYEDIRLLGQILGDTVREQEGETVFARIEAIRRLSVAGQRKADPAAGRELDALLESLTPSETVSVIRAFTYFSHLANIAEDRHFLRRRASAAQAGPESPSNRGREPWPMRSNGWRRRASRRRMSARR